MNKPTKVAHKATVATTNHADRIRAVVSPLGIEAWLVEDYTVPIIAVEGLIEGGTSQDPADRPGLLHCLMGTLDEGAGPYDSTAFQERLDDFAIELSFGADRDHASFHLRTLARHRDEAFDMLRLALTEARLDSDSVERVRAQIDRSRCDGASGVVCHCLCRTSLWTLLERHAGLGSRDHPRRSRPYPHDIADPFEAASGGGRGD